MGMFVNKIKGIDQDAQKWGAEVSPLPAYTTKCLLVNCVVLSRLPSKANCLLESLCRSKAAHYRIPRHILNYFLRSRLRMETVHKHVRQSTACTEMKWTVYSANNSCASQLWPAWLRVRATTQIQSRNIKLNVTNWIQRKVSAMAAAYIELGKICLNRRDVKQVDENQIRSFCEARVSWRPFEFSVEWKRFQGPFLDLITCFENLQLAEMSKAAVRWIA